VRACPTIFLKSCNIAVFGLGDSSYAKFNFASKKLFKVFSKLGANLFVERGNGNVQDDEGYYTALFPWIEKLITNLQSLNIKGAELIIKQKRLYDATIISKNMLTPCDHFQEILEVGLSVENYDDFEPGDTIRIYPSNYNWREFCDYIGNVDDEDHVRNTMDYNFVPFFRIFAEIVKYLEDEPLNDYVFKNPERKEAVIRRIREMSTDYELYFDYVKRPKRTFFEVLQDFALKLPFSFLKKIVPNIQPRYFTLTKRESSYYLTIALVEYQNSIKAKRKGLCSQYLREINVKESIKVGMVKSHLFYDSANLLFICTGTGITLPRAFWNFFTDKNIVVFYGYRHDDKDRLYVEEMKKNKNVKVVYAPSRMGEELYVQEIFYKYFHDSIDQYLIYVSGRTRLNKEVRQMFVKKYGAELYFQAETW
ncbi:NADP-dependent flavoprotein reductase, partial [Trachipleistophora hominis]